VIFHGLKTNIALHLVLLLVVAMFLIDFIVISAVHRLLKADTLSNGDTIMSTIHAVLSDASTEGGFRLNDANRENLTRISRNSDILCIRIWDGKHSHLFSTGTPCVSENLLRQTVDQAVNEDRRVVRNIDTTWGVFWRQSRYTILAAPFHLNGNHLAAAGIILPLDGIYQRLRHVQHMVLTYIFINTGLLTLIGVYGLSRVTVRPLQRLVKMADEYSDYDDMHFLYERDVSEFNRLSTSLNHMLKRISDDKEKLQTTIASLEKANLELQSAQKKIIRAEKFATIGRLSSGLAHEIGNPIGIVLGYLELLRQHNVSEEEKEGYLDRAESEISRINALIRQLLELSRASKTDFVSVSVHKLIDDIAEVIQQQPSMTDIHLKLNLAAEAETILADPGQLRQVFLNLILNSADALASLENPERGILTISTEVTSRSELGEEGQEKMLQIRFIDNGPGISDRRIGTVFDPFYTTKEPGKGTGLGLFVSYGIVEGIGGTIEVVSEEGQGATFVILLPLHKTDGTAET